MKYLPVIPSVMIIIAWLLLTLGCATADMAAHDHYEHAAPAMATAAPAGPSHSDYAWRRLRNAWIAENPACAVCGIVSKKNQVHHRIPRSVRPDLFLDRGNLITGCHRHHFWVYHAGDYRSYNVNLDESISAIQDAYERTVQKP